jgi:ferredoxin
VISYERCVRTRAVSSSCRACVDACPAGAITLTGPKQSVSISLDACTDCGLCQAACPTEAIAVYDVSRLTPRRELACGDDGLPCVAALCAEDLVPLALKGPLTLVGKACPAGAKAHARVAATLAEVHAFLAAVGLGATLDFRDETPPAPPPVAAPPAQPIPPRRQFLGLLVPRALPPTRGHVTQPETLDVKRLRDTTPPLRRARLLASLPPSIAPRASTTDVRFTSSKQLDANTCTGCMACVTACPTGALTTTRLRDQVRFDASRCVKCALCHDVCEPRALTLAPAFQPADFLDFAPRTLVKLELVQCGECGASYKKDGAAQVLCARCREQDAEARELQGFR